MVKRAIKEFRLVSLGHITAGSKFDADPNSYRMFGSHVVLNLVGQIAKTCMFDDNDHQGGFSPCINKQYDLVIKDIIGGSNVHRIYNV